MVQPAGAVPPFDPTNSDMVGWAQETSLDVEWAHVTPPRRTSSSHVFDRPDFQDHVKSVVGHARGTPDISLNATVDGGV